MSSLFFTDVSVLVQAGDIITQVESVDKEWILGVVGGKRGIAPKNYISFPWRGNRKKLKGTFGLLQQLQEATTSPSP